MIDATSKGKSEGCCAWCGADISHRHRQTIYCSPKCKDTSRRRAAGVVPFSEARSCEVCGSDFVAKTSTRKYCTARCRQSAQREMGREANTQNARRYRRDFPERYRKYYRDRRADAIEEIRARSREYYNQMKHDRPDAYRAMLEKQRERERKRAAQAALSAILLPTQKHPEV